MGRMNMFALVTTLQVLYLFARGSGEQLFFTSPGNGSLAAGLYGGPLASGRGGAQDSLLQYGYHCAERRGQLQTGLSLQAVAYDPVSSRVLFQISEDDGRTLSLYRGHLCHASKCSNDSNAPTPLFNAVQMNHQVGPFAYHDNKIYFIIQKELRQRPGQKRGVTELRELTGCEDRYPVQPSTVFDITQCSRLVATLAEDDYRRYPAIRVTSGLTLTRQGGRKVFLVQLQRDTYSEGILQQTSFVLYSVGDQSGRKRALHTEHVPTRYAMYILTQLGAVAYADGRVCWTAIDRVLCANFDGDELSNVRTVLKSGQASSVCKAPGEPELANVVTGVAFQESRDGQLTLYFGCVADTARFGGAGVVTAARAEVFPLTVDRYELFAGSMFITEECRHTQPYSYTSTASFVVSHFITLVTALSLTCLKTNIYAT